MKLYKYHLNIIRPGGFSWNFGFIRNLNDRELEQVSSLINLLDSYCFHSFGLNKRIWHLDKSGSYSCKSMFKKLISNSLEHHFSSFSFIWKSCCPMKVKVFTWLISLNKTNTQDLLQKRLPFLSISLGWCSMCGVSDETRDHLFYIVLWLNHCGIDFWMNLVWLGSGPKVVTIFYNMFQESEVEDLDARNFGT